ncbi:MAG: hypothetical protein GJ676_02765 [Rhodobacteraceae bacterium]|nr:hypothetical protein [Paracoccaceae bacterium]
MLRIAGPLIGVLCAAGSVASACGFHNYTPQSTLVDRLLNSDHIVLARQDPSDPFQYSPTSALEGSINDVDIPFLVDSTTRRKLSLQSDHQVLFARDGMYGPWQRVAFIDNDLKPVLDAIMTHLGAWELGNDLSRFQTFASLMNHPNTTIRHLALQELDRANYGFLSTHPLPIDPNRILRVLNDPTQVDMKPIRVLLLGLSGDSSVAPVLERGLARSIPVQDSLIGAYATALIETQGQTAVQRLAQIYLADPAVPILSKEMIVEAFALHSQYGDDEMRQAVSDVMQDVLWYAPELAAAVARQFGARSVWTQAQLLQNMVKQGALSSIYDVLAVSRYVALAQEASSMPGYNSSPALKTQVTE